VQAFPAYDPVAELYDRAFADIRVREVELSWLSSVLAGLGKKPRLLDLGAGNGALLEALAPKLLEGVGVDISEAMLARAEARARGASNLRFERLTGPHLPFADASFDVVVSFLSFRYLDWQCIWPEIRRVLGEGGRFFLVDLVKERATLDDASMLMRSALRHAWRKLTHRAFLRDLGVLIGHPDWVCMLARHPMRELAEYRAFFAGRVPEPHFATLDVLLSRRVVALDSGPLVRSRDARPCEPGPLP
jgi:SAM-dependent methyltransferase